MAAIRFLGFADAAACLVFGASQFFSMPLNIIYILSAYLIMKGTAFTVMFKDIASIIDLICGIYALAMTLGFANAYLTSIAALYLGQKAVLSFVRL